MQTKKRLSDGCLVSLVNFNLLPDSELKKFEDIREIELPKAIQERIELKPILTPKRGRRKS
jgi:hypothetical protein